MSDPIRDPLSHVFRHSERLDGIHGVCVHCSYEYHHETVEEYEQNEAIGMPCWPHVLQAVQERDEARAALLAIRTALGNGADEAAWKPGVTMAQAVERLRGERAAIVAHLRAQAARHREWGRRQTSHEHGWRAGALDAAADDIEGGGHWPKAEAQSRSAAPSNVAKTITGAVLGASMSSDSDDPDYDGIGYVTVYAPSEQIAGVTVGCGSRATVTIYEWSDAEALADDGGTRG